MKNKEKIIALIKEDLGDCFSYHEKNINEILDYLGSVVKSKEDGTLWWLNTYKEDIEMKTTNEIGKTIENRLINRKEDYTSWTNLESSNKEDEQLINAIGMLNHIAHCYNPL